MPLGKKNHTKYSRNTVWQRQYTRASSADNVGDKMLRGMNSGLCFIRWSAHFKPKKKEKSSFVAQHKSLKRPCPRIVAMQAVSGSRKDWDSFLTEWSALCECLYGEIFYTWHISRVLKSFHTRYALKWTNKYPDISFTFVFTSWVSVFVVSFPFPRLLVPLYRRDLDPFCFYYT